MADAILAAVQYGLADKLYEKRKIAALEIEGIVKQLALAGDHEKISAVINLLTTEFTYSPQSNHRKGGLIGPAAVTVGLAVGAPQHLESRVIGKFKGRLKCKKLEYYLGTLHSVGKRLVWFCIFCEDYTSQGWGRMEQATNK